MPAFTLSGFTSLLLAASIAATPARAARADLYACDGCAAMLEVDPCSVDAHATVAGPDEPGERLQLRGRVYRSDGRTPAADVLIYLHQANARGDYADGRGSIHARRHGRLRAWVRSDADGRYAFDSIVPGRYPDGRDPAHLHLMVEESGRPPYYLDDVVFAGAPGVDDAFLARQQGRGGPGVVELGTGPDGTRLAVRDIVLERHPVPPRAGRVWRCEDGAGPPRIEAP